MYYLYVFVCIIINQLEQYKQKLTELSVFLFHIFYNFIKRLPSSVSIILFHIFTAETQKLFLRSICIHGLISFRVWARLVNSWTSIGAYIPSTTLDPFKQYRFESTVTHLNWDDILATAPTIYNQSAFFKRSYYFFAAF